MEMDRSVMKPPVKEHLLKCRQSCGQ